MPYDSKVASCVADFWTRWINLPWYINILHPHGAILGGNTEWLSVAGGNSDWEARRNTKRQAGRQAGRQAESSAGLKAAEFGTKKTTTGGKVPRCNRPLAPAITES